MLLVAKTPQVASSCGLTRAPGPGHVRRRPPALGQRVGASSVGGEGQFEQNGHEPRKSEGRTGRSGWSVEDVGDVVAAAGWRFNIVCPLALCHQPLSAQGADSTSLKPTFLLLPPPSPSRSMLAPPPPRGPGPSRTLGCRCSSWPRSCRTPGSPNPCTRCRSSGRTARSPRR